MKKSLIGLALLFLACSESDLKEVETTGPDIPNAVDSQEKYIGSILINEISVINNRLPDEDAEDPGWIELYNNSDDTASTAGLYLKEKLDRDGWKLPSLKLPPKSHLLVFASKKNRSADTILAKDYYGLTQDFSAWADIDHEDGGTSTIAPLDYSTFIGGTGPDQYEVSAEFYIGDNSANFGWQSSSIEIFFNDDQVSEVDLSAYDKIIFNANVPDGKFINFSIMETTKNNWEGERFLINGQGEKAAYEFDIPISKVERSEIKGVRIDAPAMPLETNYSFNLSDLYFVRSKQYGHTNFKLEKEGGKLYLTDSLNNVWDKWEYGTLGLDQTLGRKSDGSKQLVLFANGTPDASNQSMEPKYFNTSLASPSIASGFYTDSIELGFVIPEGSKLFYSTNGNTMAFGHAQAFTVPLTIDKTQSIHWYTVNPQGVKSQIKTATYFINDHSDLDVISITVEEDHMFGPDNGMYMLGNNASDELPFYGANYWKERELPIHVEFYRNGTREWNANAGLQIFGNWSRANAKKSLALYFREAYGLNKLRYPIFEEDSHRDEFKSIVLRGNGGNFKQDHYRDGLNHTLASQLGIIHQRYNPSVVYINGKYWGIHNIRDKVNDDHFEINYDTSNHGFDLLKIGYDPQAGNTELWDQFKYQLSRANNDPDSWTEIKKTFDVDDYINYLSLETFIVNTDWPANNFKVYKSYASESKWRYVLYDTDFSYGWPNDDYDYDMIFHLTDLDAPNWPNGPSSTKVFRDFFKIDEFKRQFSNTLAVHFATSLSSTNIERVRDSIKTRISGEYDKDMKRWEQDSEDFDYWDTRTETFIKNREREYREHLVTQMGLGSEVSTTIDPKGGIISVEAVPISSSTSITFWESNKVKLKAIPTTGKAFKSWSNGETTQEILWEPSSDEISVNWQ